MRWHAAVSGLVLLIGAAIGEQVLLAQAGMRFGLLLGPVALLLIYTIGFAPARRYRAWSYGLEADELRLAHGVWTRSETHVPLARVQHVDVSQGPVERAAGVCRLILHTAGTAHGRVVLPGLARATAEGIRDEVRAQIRAEEA